ncbi:rCG54354 [Rattus norvegicus]|uniref:RCG54354 n=1 Tax=Rattus norvegicus TaxID=10116 RepID=A6J8N2_RAT|nr:rCG54354 [Rattus norvegicus]
MQLETLRSQWRIRDVRQLHVHASAQPGAQVGGAGEHVAQVLVPHEGVTSLLEDLLNLRRGEGTRSWVPNAVCQGGPRRSGGKLPSYCLLSPWRSREGGPPHSPTPGSFCCRCA